MEHTVQVELVRKPLGFLASMQVNRLAGVEASTRETVSPLQGLCLCRRRFRRAYASTWVQKRQEPTLRVSFFLPMKGGGYPERSFSMNC